MYDFFAVRLVTNSKYIFWKHFYTFLKKNIEIHIILRNVRKIFSNIVFHTFTVNNFSEICFEHVVVIQYAAWRRVDNLCTVSLLIRKSLDFKSGLIR